MSLHTAGFGLSLRRLVMGGPRAPQVADFTATRLMVVDVQEPLPPIEGGSTPAGEPYGTAEILVRLHARPLGVLEVDLKRPPMSAEQLRVLIDQRWGDIIRRHLKADDEHRAGIAGSGKPGDPWDSCPLRPTLPPPYVTVVVPTYRRPLDLARCVDSILATEYPRLEVIIVDNGPQDRETAALVARRYAADHRVRYLREWIPGASRARNLGVRSARGEMIGFVDDDIVVDRHWLSAMTQALLINPEVGCVTGLCMPMALDTPVQLWFEQFGGFNLGYEQRFFDLNGRTGDSLLYPYTAGALGGIGCSVFRRSALRQPDAFDVALGPGTPAFGAEDQDALVALLRAGGRLMYEPAGLARHRHREEYADLRWQAFTYGAGFTAALFHWALHDRAVALELFRRVPPLLPLAFGLRGRGETLAVDTCRPELRWLERMGYLYGPVAYARALLQRRRVGLRNGSRAGNAVSDSLEREARSSEPVTMKVSR